MKDIAAKAKVGEKSVYRYFNTKKELLTETSFMLWQEIVSSLKLTIDDAYYQKTGLQQIAQLLQGFRRLFESNSDYVLFSYDYKLFLIRHAARMTQDEYAHIIEPLHVLYVNALKKGMEDGSIKLHQNIEDLYFALWGIMRGFVVKIVIYDRMFEGLNPWESRFDLTLSILLSALRNGIDE